MILNFYSAPHKGFPEELPLYWRFEDGTVRTDLRSLSDEELAKLGWIGPIKFLTPRQLDENGNDLVEEYDYDPATHKAVWYSAERKFVVVDKDVDERPYMSGELITVNSGPADWDTFKKTAIISAELNAYVSAIMSVAPLAATALPATLIKIEDNSYDDFENTWKVMNAVSPIPAQLLQQLIALATSCNLPVKFIEIISNT